MKNTTSRRNFLKTVAIGSAGLALFPQMVTGRGFSTSKENLRLGFIGLGQQSMHLMSSFIKIPGVEVIAGCDVYGIKRKRFEKRVTDYYTNRTKKEGKAAPDTKVVLYEDYNELLARKDIDTVVIATPDHWHAFIAIAACNAKKNVYIEKPLTFTIKEGQELVKAVRRNKVILGVGSQQRSDANFQHAVKMVQTGKIGKVLKVNASVGAPPKPYDLPEQAIPADLNWKMWLGPSEYIHHNSELAPPISIDPEINEKVWAGWRWYKEVGGGFTTDWGAHMFDIAQWGIGMDGNGPVEIIPAGYKNTKYLTFKYKGGIVMTEEPYDEKQSKGVKFWGKKGWIEVSREQYNASDPSLFPAKEEPKDGTAYERKASHHENFIYAVRKGIDPIVPVEIGHSTCTVCTLGNLAHDLKRPLKWNPQKQQFVNDQEATGRLTKIYSPGYTL